MLGSAAATERCWAATFTRCAPTVPRLFLSLVPAVIGNFSTMGAAISCAAAVWGTTDVEILDASTVSALALLAALAPTHQGTQKGAA